MTANYNFYLARNIRLGASLSLIFFALLLAGCKQKGVEGLKLEWSGKQAIGIKIPQSLLPDYMEQDPKTALQVRLQNSEVPMLGAYKVSDEEILFTPLLPLSPGKHYEVFYNRDRVGRVTVPAPDKRYAPELIALYPSADTVPENLLKLYLRFSSPMRESEALRHIHLLNENGDTIPDVFLDLQPELWNSEGTTLTLWLDPGRIKRDLIPNQRLGNPLKRGKQYHLVIDSTWKDVHGLAMRQGYTKRFSAGQRDQTFPQPEVWAIDVPVAGSTDPLRIHFKEPLDYFLLMETIQVVNKEGRVVETNERVMEREEGVEMVPEKRWVAGHYRIKIASYLEDLAGNNLNWLFDRDVTEQQKNEQGFRERPFVIK